MTVSPLPHPFLNAWRSLLWEFRLLARLTLSRLLSRSGLPRDGKVRLHLGCGRDVRPGWVNVDLDPVPRDGAVTIPADLRRTLPLPDGICSEIYSSHFLEHVDYAVAQQFLRECRRLLAEGGVLRLCLPDMRMAAKAWIEDDEAFLRELQPELVLAGWDRAAATLTDHFDYAVHQNGEHRIVTDRSRCEAMLRSAGFRDVRATSYDPTIDPPDPLREKYSFVLLAIP